MMMKLLQIFIMSSFQSISQVKVSPIYPSAFNNI